MPSGSVPWGLADLCTSVVVAGELRYGAAKRNAARLTQRLAAVFAEPPILPIEVPIDAIYGTLRAALEQRGRPINDPDYWIAAQALAGDHILVTDDSDFARILELKRENWLVLDSVRRPSACVGGQLRSKTEVCERLCIHKAFALIGRL